jgi:hypothetical protein
MFLDVKRVHDHGNRQPGDDDGHRHQEQDGSDDIDPSLRPRRHLAEEDVDADVLAVL